MGSPVLPYEDSLNVDGLTVTRAEGFIRIVTPRPGTWRAINKWLIFGAIYFLFIVPVELTEASQPGADYLRRISGAVASVTLAGVFVGFAIRRMRQHYVFEVTPTRFSILLSTSASSGRPRLYFRPLVRSVNPSVADPRRLVVRITGKEMQELFISRDKDMVRRLSELLNEALAEPMAPIDVPTPATAAPKPQPSRLARSLAFALVMLALMVGLYVALVEGSAIAGIITFGVIAAPVGIVYGTQKKDTWV